jgi:hypothetical protein
VRVAWGVFGFLLAWAVGGQAAEIERLGPTNDQGRRLGYEYRLSGEIQAGDTGRLARLFEADAADPGSAVTALARARSVAGALHLELDSPGGDMEEAMRLGRWLRHRYGFAAVREADLCASACVLVLAGAVHRSTAGTVVVHRHTLESPSPARARETWQRVQESVRRYLRDMNVPGTLLDLALEAPPEKGRTLTREEKKRFLLSGWDPAAEEERTATLAEYFGTTSGEFRRWWAATEVTCGSEDLVERRAFTLELDSAGRDRAEAMRAAWRDCRWKAMRPMGRQSPDAPAFP